VLLEVVLLEVVLLEVVLLEVVLLEVVLLEVVLLEVVLLEELLLEEAAGAAVRMVVEPVFFAGCCRGTDLSMPGLRVEPTNLRNREFMDDTRSRASGDYDRD